MDELSHYDMREIVITTSGETGGVCATARLLAKELRLPLLVRWADCGKFAQGAFDHRSRAILQGCDRSFFVWDGRSRGTRNEIALADKLKVPYRIERLQGPGHAGDDDDLESKLMPVDVACLKTFEMET